LAEFLKTENSVSIVLSKLKKWRVLSEFLVIYMQILQELSTLGFFNSRFFLNFLEQSRSRIASEGGLDILLAILEYAADENIELKSMQTLATFYRLGTKFPRNFLTLDPYRDMINQKINWTNFETLLQEPTQVTVTDPTVAESGIKHQMEKVHFSKPTFCSFCGEFIWGILKQGYSCKGKIFKLKFQVENLVCAYPTHKRCADKSPANCVGSAASKQYALSAHGIGEMKAEGEVAPPKSLQHSADVYDPSVELTQKMLKWAGSGKVLIHREIVTQEITGIVEENLVYKSPLCEVYKGNALWIM
jgi:hypothetical protein